VLGRLRRQRDAARSESRRLLGVLTQEVQATAGVRIVQHGSLRLLLEPSSLVDRSIIAAGGWESEQIDLMTSVARAIAADPRRKLFLDIGAHWGLYALTMWRLGIFDEIHCFEPEPHNLAQLEAQLFLNGASYDIAVHRAAALDAPATVHIRRSLSISDGNRAAAALTAAAEDTAPVPAVAVDDVIDAKGCIVFIKIDTEGSERRVLDGMRRVLAENDIYMQVEIFPESDQDLSAHIPQHLIRRAHYHWDHIYSTFDWNPTF
jgi:FkbM family methyltransferase